MKRSPALLSSLVLSILGCTSRHGTSAAVPPPPGARATPATSPAGPPAQNLTDAEREARRQRLTPEQRHVVAEQGTEAPFRNAYWNQHAPGIYVDVVSGEPLFSSRDKFDSGTGWPSFTAPLEEANVVRRTDITHGMTRVEVRSRVGDSHLGHQFDDGPAPTGQRYCMNSAALRFVPAERLTAEGYGQYASRFPDVVQQGAAPSPAPAPSQPAPANTDWPADSRAAATLNRTGVAAEHEVAVLGGGCFWGMEHLLRGLPGVVSTDVGYAGGTEANASYDRVSEGTTGHAESVRVVFDPRRVSYEDVLRFFFRIHDPTTENRQHNDVGTQYRSVIFAQTPEQRVVAERVRARANEATAYRGHVVTQIVPAARFFPAEAYHQDYLERHPDGYTCHFVRNDVSL